MKRYGSVIGVRPDRVAEYRRLHAAVWPEVLATLRACNIRDYTIYLREPENLLFATFVYVGADFAADMAQVAADLKTQEWWGVTAPLQTPLETRLEGEWWAPMEEVFHVD